MCICMGFSYDKYSYMYCVWIIEKPVLFVGKYLTMHIYVTAKCSSTLECTYLIP